MDAALRDTAHALKGSCRQIGAVRMATLSEQLQRRSEAGATAAEVKSLLDEIEMQFALVQNTLKDKGHSG